MLVRQKIARQTFHVAENAVDARLTNEKNFQWSDIKFS